MRPPLSPPVALAWTMSDGCRINGRSWNFPVRSPDHGPIPSASLAAHPGLTSRIARPGVLYLHGIQSHGGWYEWSASVLADAGLAVLMPDRRGSGANLVDRGDVASVQRWFDDLGEHAAWMSAHGADCVGVVGVSWGGKLALAWLIESQRSVQFRTLSNLLLIAPGIFPQVGIGLAGRLAVAWSWIADPTRLFELPLTDAALFTENPTGRSFIDADPLKLTHVTGRFLVHSHSLDRRLASLPSASIHSSTTLLLGQRDRIIRNDATQRWLSRVCSTPAEVHVLPAGHHTLEFGFDVSEFESYLREWARTLLAFQTPIHRNLPLPSV